MTGTKRLRSLASVWYEWGLGWMLADIADEIERECDAEVADSPYEAILPEDRDALTWVREHGGIDHVKEGWHSRVPYDRYEARRQRLLGHIAECETALGRRREIISELTHRVKALTNENAELRRRTMTEGCEWLIEAWPKFEDDAPVKLGDMALIDGDVDMVEAVQIWIHGKPVICGDNGSQQLEKDERVKRPVLAADGEPLEVGQTVWDVLGNRRFKVLGFSSDPKLGEFSVKTVGIDGMSLEGYSKPSDLTHQRPVLDAHGMPIREGDMVYDKDAGDRFEVDGFSYDYVVCTDVDACESDIEILPSQLTHTKPEIDSWQRIEEDALLPAGDYRELHGMEKRDGMTLSQQIREDLVHRCRALAERERGE